MKNRSTTISGGLQTITPYLVAKGAPQAIEFYKKVFGAQEKYRLSGPDGKSILHAELLIGDSHFFLTEEMPEMGSLGPTSTGGSPVTLYVYFDDVDAVFNRAVEAGAQVKMQLADMFWGDRYGVITDPFGHVWSLATHKEDLTPEEVNQRAQKLFSQ
jgi:uncharacterized glyoxalase superfamily protein PhnB